MISWIISFILILFSLDEKRTPPVEAVPYTITYANINYAYTFVSSIDPQKLILIPNYSEKKLSSELMSEYKCLAGINGGFYGEDGKAQGLVIIDKVTLSRAKKSLILNGYITINKDLKIGKDFSGTPNFALQTGPVLISMGKEANLKLEKDKPARRMVMGNNLSGKSVILAVFDPETENIGPYLTDLPAIVNLINNKENLSLTEAVNLDGGGASAYYSSKKVITESVPVGSWWCVLPL